MNDATQVSTGEVFTDAFLVPYFGEGYRRLFNNLMGASKRVERTVYLNLPAFTTVLIPSTVGITDMQEPELLEERIGTSQVAITSTTNATPISVLSTAHGLNTNDEIVVSGVASTYGPWGQWFVTRTDANNFTLNGSGTNGAAGTGGYFTVPNSQNWSTMQSVDFLGNLDGVPTQFLQGYLWENQRFYFRGSNGVQQLRITYWASGAPPTNTNTVINIDNCIDFLANATAYSACYALGWEDAASHFYSVAYGDGTQGSGLIGDFVAFQVRQLQRGPVRRQLPFRDKRSRWGGFFPLGGN